MRGRKPKKDAQRRGGHMPSTHRAEIIENKVRKPAHIENNQLQSECWDALIGDSPNFQESDIPLLESYCFWYAVLRQAENQVITQDGKVITLYGSEADGGQTVRANPDIKTAEKATAMLMRLGDALNLSPVARDRAGLVQAMTKSTQMDIVERTLDGYRMFKDQQRALDAKK